MVEAKVINYKMVETQTEAANFDMVVFKAITEAVKKSTASTSLVSRYKYYNITTYLTGCSHLSFKESFHFTRIPNINFNKYKHNSEI